MTIILNQNLIGVVSRGRRDYSERVVHGGKSSGSDTAAVTRTLFSGFSLDEPAVLPSGGAFDNERLRDDCDLPILAPALMGPNSARQPRSYRPGRRV